MNEIFKAIDELNLNKVKWFSFGKFCYAFLNKEPVFINELLPLIESLLEDNGFQMTVMLAYNDDLKEKEALLKNLMLSVTNLMQMPTIHHSLIL